MRGRKRIGGENRTMAVGEEKRTTRRRVILGIEY